MKIIKAGKTLIVNLSHFTADDGSLAVYFGADASERRVISFNRWNPPGLGDVVERALTCALMVEDDRVINLEVIARRAQQSLLGDRVERAIGRALEELGVCASLTAEVTLRDEPRLTIRAYPFAADGATQVAVVVSCAEGGAWSAHSHTHHRTGKPRDLTPLEPFLSVAVTPERLMRALAMPHQIGTGLQDVATIIASAIERHAEGALIVLEQLAEGGERQLGERLAREAEIDTLSTLRDLTPVKGESCFEALERARKVADDRMAHTPGEALGLRHATGDEFTIGAEEGAPVEVPALPDNLLRVCAELAPAESYVSAADLDRVILKQRQDEEEAAAEARLELEEEDARIFKATLDNHPADLAGRIIGAAMDCAGLSGEERVRFAAALGVNEEEAMTPAQSSEREARWKDFTPTPRERVLLEQDAAAEDAEAPIILGPWEVEQHEARARVEGEGRPTLDDLRVVSRTHAREGQAIELQAQAGAAVVDAIAQGAGLSDEEAEAVAFGAGLVAGHEGVRWAEGDEVVFNALEAAGGVIVAKTSESTSPRRTVEELRAERDRLRAGEDDHRAQLLKKLGDAELGIGEPVSEAERSFIALSLGFTLEEYRSSDD